MSASSDGPVLTAALRYASELGWHVFPLHQKKPAIPGPGGHLAASNDPDAIRALWEKAGAKADGVGVNLEASRLLLVDIDPRNGGDIDRLRAEFGPLDETPEALTGGGGVHLFYARPAVCAITSKSSALGAGIDVKTNGYAALSPSAHPSGTPYRWHLSPDTPLAEAPEWAAGALAAPGRANTNGASLTAVVQYTGGPIPEGKRNDQLASLGGTMRRRGFSQGAITAALLEHARENGVALPEHEIEAIARSVGRYEPDPGEVAIGLIPDACVPGKFGLDDVGNAGRLVELFGHRLRWCNDFGDWLVYDGRRWVRDRREEALGLAKQAILSIGAEARTCGDDATSKAILKWAHSSLTLARISNALQLAKPDVAVRSADFDAHPWLLNVANGTLDLQSGELRAHSPDDLLTKMCPVDYDAGAASELWDRFLETATDNDAELIGYLQRVAGAALAGEAREDVWFFVYGPGGTAKTTWLRALGFVLGDYAVTLDGEAILSQFRGRAGTTPELSKVEGARLVTVEEVAPNRKLDVAIVKNLSGGSVMNTNDKYEKARSWIPQSTLIVAANDRPSFRGHDSGMKRRLREVPFEHVIPDADQDPTLKDTRRGLGFLAGPAILSWAVEGCLQWQRDGLGTAARVQAATDDHLGSLSRLARWVDDHVIVEPDAWTPTAELYADYKAHAEAEGEKPITAQDMGKQLQADGYTVERRRGAGARCNGYVGLRLRSNNDE